MKKLLVITGEITFAQKGQTKQNREFTDYQVRSLNSKGKPQHGDVRDYFNRDFKIGDEIKVAGFESASLWKDKIFSQVLMISPEDEAREFALLGLNGKSSVRKAEIKV